MGRAAVSVVLFFVATFVAGGQVIALKAPRFLAETLWASVKRQTTTNEHIFIFMEP